MSITYALYAQELGMHSIDADLNVYLLYCGVLHFGVSVATKKADIQSARFVVGMKGLVFWQQQNCCWQLCRLFAKSFVADKKEKRPAHADLFSLVGMKGLEPSRRKALVPKTSVSTNSTTSPGMVLVYYMLFSAICHLDFT